VFELDCLFRGGMFSSGVRCLVWGVKCLGEACLLVGSGFCFV